MSPSSNKNKKRLIFMFVIVCLTCTALTFRIGWIQVVASERYATLAIEQQTRDVPISAKRGVIYDRNMNELAISAVTNTIWANPSGVRSGKTDEAKAEQIAKTATALSEILEMDRDEVTDIITREQSLVKVAKYVDKETADKIRKEGLPGISIAEDVKRHYPLGAFASHILGGTTDDNQGLAGIELQYNKYLSGTPGRWIKNTDVRGDSLAHGVEKYYSAENGLSVVLTIDEVIQHYVEKSIAQVQADTQADRVYCLVMDPKTGEILAMALTPDYDPNDPRTPLDEALAEYVDGLSGEEQMEYWNSMWRNPMVSDVYEPGSTFKLLTTSIALEQGVTNPNENFTCVGYTVVGDRKLKCWRTNPHGLQTLTQAVENSCNPVFVELGRRIGIDTYYDYMEKFGLREKTGISFPGEAVSILQNKDTAGAVGLATMAYGQGIAVTPIGMLTAISSLGNEGMLMEPILVKALVDEDGNVVQEFKPKEVRQVISQQTAADMCEMMESVVSEGGGGTAKIEGYRIGGKTGTANKAKNGGYSSETDSSFVGMVPMDDPQLAILLVVDNPKGIKYGSQTAAPGVKAILEETLPYLGLEPEYTAEELAAIESGMVTVPDLTGKGYDESIGILGGVGLPHTVSPALTEEDNFVVVDQYPKAGTQVEAGTQIYLYRQ